MLCVLVNKDFWDRLSFLNHMEVKKMLVDRARRNIKTLCVITILSLLVLGMFNSQSMAAEVTIRFAEWSHLGATGIDVNKKIVKMFEESHPDIQVKYEPLVGDWFQRLTTEMAAGRAPDIYPGYGPDFLSWLERGQALDLTPYFDEEDLEDFFPFQLNLMIFDGKLYGLPKYCGGYGLWYNQDLFDEVGVAYPDETWDWDKLLEAATKLTKEDSSGKTVQWGYGLYTWILSHPTGAMWIYQNGGRLYPEGEFIGSKILLDEPEALEALQFMHDLRWKYGVSPTAAMLGDQQAAAYMGFPAGKTAMLAEGAPHVQVILDAAEFRWDIAPVAKGPVRRAIVSTIDGYAVYSGTKHPEEAVEFLRFLGSPEVERLLLQEEGLQPARRSVLPLLAEESAGAKAGKNMGVYVDSMKYAFPSTVFKNQAKVSELWEPVEQAVFELNKEPLEEAIKDVVVRINEVLSSSD